MISDHFLKKLLITYGVLIETNEFESNILPEYPHITKINIGDETYYLKELVVNETRRDWIEKVYSHFEYCSDYVHPMKNEFGTYTYVPTKRNDINSSGKSNAYCYLLTKEQEEIRKKPSVKWWAECLANAHNSNLRNDFSELTLGDIKREYGNSLVIIPSYSDVIARLKSVSNIIENDVMNLINSILPEDSDANILAQRGVFVHGDPLISNVLFNDNQYVLFDFESSGISVKEYDIQRLFTDIATNCKTLNEVDDFVRGFMDEYELVGQSINSTLLDYVFRLDLIRTIFWLYEMSMSYNRQDFERQTIELEKYKAALRSGLYHRVISAIHHTWHYNSSNIKINNCDRILEVAKIVSAIVPDFVCATLGGSRSHFLDDAVSDVEMYFYSRSGIPTIDQIGLVLENAGAIHRRSPSFLWNEEPWGPHSFFEIDGLYFEIGYRIVGDVENKIKDYLSGNTVEPQKDCHDLGLGYLFSGLTASVQAEKIVICSDDSFFRLKDLANEFPNSLMDALINEYLNTAEKLIRGKLLVAAQRQDAFFYNVLSTRVIRCLMIMAFSVSKTHFPGDKWNEILLLHTKWDNANRLLQLLNSHMKMDTSYDMKYKMLFDAFEIVKNDLLDARKEC